MRGTRQPWAVSSLFISHLSLHPLQRIVASLLASEGWAVTIDSGRRLYTPSFATTTLLETHHRPHKQVHNCDEGETNRYQYRCRVNTIRYHFGVPQSVCYTYAIA